MGAIPRIVPLLCIIIFTAYVYGAPAAIKANPNGQIIAAGSPVFLQGVNRYNGAWCGAQNSALDGPLDITTVTAMQSWDINTVRIPLNQFCYMNRTQATFRGGSYTNAIKTYVQLLTSNNFYVILTLAVAGPPNGSPTVAGPMPDNLLSVQFWTKVAQAYASYSNVIFDLYDQPAPLNGAMNSTAWECWLNGDNSSNCAGYPAAGMQTLVNTVRASAPKNIIMISGIDYGNSLDQWLKYMPESQGGNLVAGFQVTDSSFCNGPSCWYQTVQPIYQALYAVIWVTFDLVDGCDCEISCEVPYWANSNNQFVSGYWDANIDCDAGALISGWPGAGSSSTNYGSQYMSTLQDMYDSHN